MIKLTIKRQLLLGLGSTLVLLAAGGHYAYRSAQNLIESSSQVSLTQETLGLITDCRSGLSAMESSARHFALVGNPLVLKEFPANKQDLKRNLASLRKRTAGNPRQQRSLDALEPLAMEKLSHMETGFELRREKGLQAVYEQAKSLRGVRLMERIMSVLWQMEREEKTLLAEHAQRQRSDAARAFLSIALGGLAAFLPVLIAILRIEKDMALRLAAEKALKESEERVHHLLDSTAEAIYAVDLEGRATLCNEACVRLLGYRSKDEVLGKDMHALIHHSQEDGSPMPRERCRIYQAFQKNQSSHVDDEVLWRADGTSFPAEYWSTPIRYGGEATGCVTTFIDISERLSSQKRLKAQHAAARVIAEGGDEAETVRRVLKAVCETLDWEEGAFWSLRDDADNLRCIEFVRKPSLEIGVFERVSRSSAGFAPGIGLPGKVWETRKPVWIADVAAEEDFLRADAAAEEGLHAAMAFPIMLGRHIYGVFEFFHRGVLKRDEALLETVAAVSLQLGQFLERKRVQQERDRFFDLSRDMFCVAGFDGYFRQLNPAWESALGFTREELMSKPYIEFIHPEDRRKVLRESTKAFQKGAESKDFEVRYLRKDGSHRWTLWNVFTLVDENLVYGVGRDISERRTLQEERDRFFNLSRDLICVAGFDGYFKQLNPAWEQTLGWSREELLSKPYTEFVHPEDRSATTAEAVFNASGSETLSFENRYRTKDGSYRWLSWTAIPYPPQSIIYAGARDVTERKQMESDLASARDAAIEASRVKAEFLANMSHEIRTPMNAIIGMTGLLLDSTISPQQRDYAETVRSAGESLLDIINDILDFSKIEAGRMVMEEVDFDLRDVVEGTAQLFAERAQSKDLELVVMFPDDFKTTLRGDPGRLRQIVSNLVSNAIKFTHKGEIVVAASKTSEDGGRAGLRLEVRDTGIGIPLESQGRLFEAFSQAESSTTRRYGGTGLGLAISKRIIEQMGGRIGFSSAPGRGSAFWCELELEKGSALPKSLPLAEDMSGLRVLVVDDSATNREIVIRQLASWGVKGEGASNGVEAVSMMARAGRTPPYDIAVLDMQMPLMDGLTLARRVRGDPGSAGMRLILMTSLGQAMKAGERQEAGIDACLAKPVKKSTLYDCLAGLVGGRPRTRPSVEASPQAAKALRRHFRVLVVEDNSVNQKVALLQLKSLGYEADAVGNGKEAVEVLSHISYSLVLMDCQMPEMDGFEATSRIRASEGESRRTPIIAMTANALEGDREKCLAAGMDDYIAKPVKIQDLTRVLSLWDKPVDRAILDGLRQLADSEDPKLLGQMFDQFIADAAAHLAAMRGAGKDAAAFSRAAHTLKGSSGSFGAKRMQSLCGLIEKALKEGKLEAAEEIRGLLAEEFTFVKAALENERDVKPRS